MNNIYQNIFVAIDPDHPTKVSQGIDIAKKLKGKDGKITLVTIITPLPDYLIKHLPAGHLEAYSQEAESKLKEHTDNESQLQTLVVSSSSSAGAALLELSAKKQIDLIVIASHQPGLKDYFLGSTAARVVRHSTCSVHVVR